MEPDVIVVGSGAAGLTCAVVAASRGLNVTVLEGARYFGGTSAFSGGGLWIPCNPRMRDAGVEDSIEEARRYLQNVMGEDYDGEVMEAYLRSGPEMVAYMEQHGFAKFLGSDQPDYEPHHDGWKAGRTVLNAPFDWRRLGKRMQDLRPPRGDMVLFHSLQVSRPDIAALKLAHRSPRAFAHAATLMLRYAWDRLRYGRGARLTNGNALIARLLVAAGNLDVNLVNRARVLRLVSEEGRVNGVVVGDGEGERTITARHGVVLASGGVGTDPELRARIVPHAAYGWNLQPEEVVGDGLKMGMAAGGRFDDRNIAHGIYQTTSGRLRVDGSREVSIHTVGDRHCPGSIIVDQATGRRFVDESALYQTFVRRMHALGVKRAWMISEGPAARAYGIGLAKPRPFPLRPWLRDGYLRSAPTIRALAEEIGLDPQGLEDTVEQFNREAQEGRDPEFGRGTSRHSQYHGDRTHKPNPCLGPLLQAPFYAVEIRPSELCVLAGLSTDVDGRVRSDDGRPIPGLYAVGLDSNTPFRGHYPGGGCSLGPGMTFAYRAAHALAGEAA